MKRQVTGLYSTGGIDQEKPTTILMKDKEFSKELTFPAKMQNL